MNAIKNPFTRLQIAAVAFAVQAAIDIDNPSDEDVRYLRALEERLIAALTDRGPFEPLTHDLTCTLGELRVAGMLTA
jgi:hypothetical protein